MPEIKVRFRDIARPSSRLPFVNNPVVLLPEKRILAAINYSDGRDTNLFLVDIDRLKDRKIPLPGEAGAYGFVRGTDGRLYIGTFSGRLYSYDVELEELKEIGRPFTKGQLIWGGGASSWGKVYMGVYPTGEFLEYDLGNGEFNLFKPMPEKNLGFYARQFVELPGGDILIHISGADQKYLIYNPGNRSYRVAAAGENSPVNTFGRLECHFDNERIIVNSDRGLRIFNWKMGSFENSDFFTNVPEPLTGIIKGEDCFYGTGVKSKSLYALDERRIKLIWRGFPRGNTVVGKLCYLPGGELVGLGDNGLFIRFDIKKRKLTSFQLKNESRIGMNIHMLVNVPGAGLLVGSHFINMQVFKINHRSGKSSSSLNKISGYGGQITCGAACGKKVYLASYGRAVIYAMDPGKPFKYGKNPAVLLEIGDEQNRPVTMLSAGKRLYIATKADYQKLGGAITVYEPGNGEMRVYRNFVRDQNPNSMFYHSPTGWLVGTTENFGDQKTAAPAGGSAVVYIWHDGKTVHTSAPWEAQSLGASDLSPDGKLIGCSAGKYYLFDITTRQYRVMDWPYAPVAGGLFMGAKYFYGATADFIFRLDTGSGEMVELAKVANARRFERLSGREIAFVCEGAVVKKMTLIPAA